MPTATLKMPKKKSMAACTFCLVILHKQNYEEEKAFSIKIISVTPLAKNIPSCNVHKNVALHQIAQLDTSMLQVSLFLSKHLPRLSFCFIFLFFYLYDVEHSSYAVASTHLFVVPLPLKPLLVCAVSVKMVSILSYRMQM